eukprot:3365221-Pleurochrysis_carterae.AAC.1
MARREPRARRHRSARARRCITTLARPELIWKFFSFHDCIFRYCDKSSSLADEAERCYKMFFCSQRS